MPVAMKTACEQLTAIIEPSEGVFVALCPELDLATEGQTAEMALDELIEMAMDYADHYNEERESFSKSPNRAAHKPYIDAIAHRATKEKVRELFV